MRRLLPGLAATILLAGALPAQQASWTTAPTMPSKGHWVLRQTAVSARHEYSNGKRRRSLTLDSRLTYGLDGEHAVFIDLPARGGGSRTAVPRLGKRSAVGRVLHRRRVIDGVGGPA